LNFKHSQLDEKDREWLIKASQVDYHALAKLAAEKPKLVYLRVSTTAKFSHIYPKISPSKPKIHA
jgi:hypothetical protein